MRFPQITQAVSYATCQPHDEQDKINSLPRFNASEAICDTLESHKCSTANAFVERAMNSSGVLHNNNMNEYENGLVFFNALPKDVLTESFDFVDDRDDALSISNFTSKTYKSFEEILQPNEFHQEHSPLSTVESNYVTLGLHREKIEDANCKCKLNDSSDTFIDKKYTDFSVIKPYNCNNSDENIQDDMHDNIFNNRSTFDFSINKISKPTHFDGDESSNKRISNKDIYFPRGIINPNYPGFQHLAHTLTEHFTNDDSNSSNSYSSSNSSETYDSDTSDFCDVESNSLESAVNYKSQTNETCRAINSSGLSMEYINSEVGCFADNKNNQTDNVSKLESDSNGCIMKNEHQTVVFLFGDTHKNNFFEKSKFDSESLNITKVKSERKSPTSATMFENCNVYNYKPIDIPATPDILIKSNYSIIELEQQTLDNYTKHEIQGKNRPDILCGVIPQVRTFNETYTDKQRNNIGNIIHIKENEGKEYIYETVSNFQCNTLPSDETEIIREEISSSGLTPIDIIGNFGQEIEQELSLLIGGYRSLSDLKQETDLNVNNKCKKSIKSIKTTDAELSVIQDNINYNLWEQSLIINKQIGSCKQNQPNEYLQNINTNAKISQLKLGTEKECNFQYRKSSYDERPLPLVPIEYKRHDEKRIFGKLHNNNNVKQLEEKAICNDYKNSKKLRLTRHYMSHSRYISSDRSFKLKKQIFQYQEQSNLQYYRQLIKNKANLLSKSKYATNSTWAQCLREKNWKKNTSYFNSKSLDDYKIRSHTGDENTLAQHLQTVKEIKKTRRHNRDVVGGNLAMGDKTTTIRKFCKNLQTRLDSTDCLQLNDIYSDTEENSSDSETCSNLMRFKPKNNFNTTHQKLPSYNDSSQKKQDETDMSTIYYSAEDLECNFFTKQAKLQIETRMALTQAKSIAKMQMDIARHNQRISPITTIVRRLLNHVTEQITYDKRRMSRQFLTGLNVAQLQIIVNHLHIHIEELNETLVDYLMERDDLRINQDVMLIDIQNLTFYMYDNWRSYNNI